MVEPSSHDDRLARREFLGRPSSRSSGGQVLGPRAVKFSCPRAAKFSVFGLSLPTVLQACARRKPAPPPSTPRTAGFARKASP
ncbi:MAG: hypothetical protein ACRDIF_03305 [Actinomycetota bacterium]